MKKPIDSFIDELNARADLLNQIGRKPELESAIRKRVAKIEFARRVNTAMSNKKRKEQ